MPGTKAAPPATPNDAAALAIHHMRPLDRGCAACGAGLNVQGCDSKLRLRVSDWIENEQQTSFTASLDRGGAMPQQLFLAFGEVGRETLAPSLELGDAAR